MTLATKLSDLPLKSWVKYYISTCSYIIDIYQWNFSQSIFILLLLVYRKTLVFVYFLLFFKIYLFIYGCVGSSFLCEGFL